MPIDRAGPVPPFWQYLAETILIPSAAPPNANLLNLVNAGLRWIHVPSYQRGISWDTEQVAEFLASDSVLLGNVILGQFALPAGTQVFPYLPGPPQVTHYHVLVDGLQRLAVGTAILSLLHHDYLISNPNRPNEAPSFAPLKALIQSRAAAYLHNDAEFMQHPRKAIRDQYLAMRGDLKKWIAQQIADGNFTDLAQSIVTTMTGNQVAIDVYFNFPSQMALMNTFLGLNTVRVDLGPIDLLRSYLIEKASSDGWSPQAIEDVENQFTDVFSQKSQPDSELLPFVKVVLELIRNEHDATRIFPSWGAGLDKDEVDRLLQFVADMKDSYTNSYVNEIRNCGTNPFAILLAFYYFQLVSSQQSPPFLTGANTDDPQLHQLLLACYRVLLDGRIGRTRDFADRCLKSTYATLGEVAEAMSQAYLATPINGQVDQGWLRGALIQADKNRAKRIFNAMLLPQKVAGFGGVFSPATYGPKSVHYQVDHLIPDSMRKVNSPGYGESDGIRNFAPLPTNQNKVAKATSCSSKLQPNGIYDVLISGAGTIHPYWVWLVKDHYPQYQPAQLDDQGLLEVNSVPAIGDARLDKISAELLTRL